MPSQRLDFIDIAKGIGILFVICSHSRCNELMWFAWAFFMPLFFILSGYTYHYKEISLLKMVKKKAQRLLVPYFFTNFVLVVILAILGKVSIQNIIGIFYSRYYIIPNDYSLFHWWCAPTWFLTALFIAYILVFLTKGKKNAEIICIPFFILITYGFCQLPILLPWSIDTAFIFASYILTGLLLRRYDFFQLSWKLAIPIGFLYLIIIHYDGNINYSIRILGNDPTMTFLAGIMGSIMVIWLSKVIDKTLIKKPLIALGRNSLLIFCFHIPIISTFNYTIEQLLFNTSDLLFYFGGICSVILTAIIGYYLALLLYKLFPFLK